MKSTFLLQPICFLLLCSLPIALSSPFLHPGEEAPALRTRDQPPGEGPLTKPYLEYVFTARVFTDETSYTPYPVDGGFRQVRPFFSNGTIYGPLLQGVILGGQETGVLSQNGSVFEAIVSAYGKTSDGADFVTTINGVGGPASGIFTRVELSIAPPYSELSDQFFVGSTTKIYNDVSVDVFRMQLKPQQ